MIQAVVFDVFGTFIQVTEGKSARTVLGIVQAECDAVVDGEEFARQWRSFYCDATDAGQAFHTEREIFTARLAGIYDRYGLRRSARADADAMMDEACLRDAFPDVRPALTALRQRYRVYIGSNTDDDLLAAVLSRNGIEVDGIYTSEGLGCYKPDPRFYEGLLTGIGLPESAVAFVGDSPLEDVLMPARLGFHAYLMDRRGRGAGGVLPKRVLTAMPTAFL